MRDETGRKALEVLKAIMQQFDDGAPQVYASALLLDDESTLHDHVTVAVQALDEVLNPKDQEKIVPRSQRRRYSTNRFGVVSGWIGKRKVKQFFTVGDAIKWVSEQE